MNGVLWPGSTKKLDNETLFFYSYSGGGLWWFSCISLVSLPGLALADRQFVISERISQMTKRNVTAFVNLTKALKCLINSMFLNVFETNYL